MSSSQSPAFSVKIGDKTWTAVVQRDLRDDFSDVLVGQNVWRMISDYFRPNFTPSEEFTIVQANPYGIQQQVSDFIARLEVRGDFTFEDLYDALKRKGLHGIAEKLRAELEEGLRKMKLKDKENAKRQKIGKL
jgi:hypothetical protein